MRTRDWDKAQRLIREWEANDRIDQSSKEPVTVEQVCGEFERDAVARGLREPTIYKYKLLSRRLQEFARSRGFRYLVDLDVSSLRDLRATWPSKNLLAIKKLEALKTFFKFAHDSGWIPQNPVSKIKNPKIVQQPTLPYEREEMIRILAACDRYAQECRKGNEAYARRLRALVLLLRYSGLRIRDAVMISQNRIKNGKLLLYMAKTGTPVYCPLPDFETNALEALPFESPLYFWTGKSKPKSAVGHWQRSLAKLFKLEKVLNGHPHRFRYTFAVENLLAGAPLEQVSTPLGHQSVHVTERHYAPWVRARQKQLEPSVRLAWTQDPIVASKTKGTSEVHGKVDPSKLLQ